MNRASPSAWPRLLSWVLTGLTLLLAALLIWQCTAIYLIGVAPENQSPAGVRLNDIYSRSIVAERLLPLAIPAVAWGILALILFAWQLILPDKKSAKASLSCETRLKLILARTKKNEAMLREERRRRNAAILCLLACSACIVISAVYLFNRNNFTSWDLEMVMGSMMLHVLPPIAVMFISLMFWVSWRHTSMIRELDAAKSAPRVSPAANASAAKKTFPLAVCRVVLYIVAIALVIAGILNGGMYDVLVKAINICTECIGLG